MKKVLFSVVVLISINSYGQSIEPPTESLQILDSNGVGATFVNREWYIIDTIAALNTLKDIAVSELKERKCQTEIQIQQFVMLRCVNEREKKKKTKRKIFLAARAKYIKAVNELREIRVNQTN